MTNKETNLLAALRAIESDCIKNHTELLASGPQFQRITTIVQTLIQALEKNSHQQ